MNFNSQSPIHVRRLRQDRIDRTNPGFNCKAGFFDNFSREALKHSFAFIYNPTWRAPIRAPTLSMVKHHKDGAFIQNYSPAYGPSAHHKSLPPTSGSL